MTDHDALLKAISDHPDDDTPRLIFADWLEENGDRDRAAFIRTDVEMDRRDPFDADRLRWELIDKPRLIIGKSPAVALPPLLPGCSWLQVPLFRRGFPWSALVSDLKSLPALARGAFAELPLTGLSLQRERLESFAPVLDVSWPRPVTSLGISDGEINRHEVSKFVASPLAATVRELRLVHDPVPADAFRVLAASPVFDRLTTLWVNGRAQARAEVDAITTRRTTGALREFSLVSTARLDLGALLAAPLLRNLEKLTLHVAPPGFAGAEQLAAAATLRSVRSLSLYANLGDAGLAAFLDSPHLTELRSLSGLTLNSARVEQLAASPTFANLRALAVGGNRLGNAGAVAIATSPHLAGLRVLNLSYTQTGDDGFRAILDSPLADGLVRLMATGSPASAEMKQAVRDRFGDRVVM